MLTYKTGLVIRHPEKWIWQMQTVVENIYCQDVQGLENLFKFVTSLFQWIERNIAYSYVRGASRGRKEILELKSCVCTEWEIRLATRFQTIQETTIQDSLFNRKKYKQEIWTGFMCYFINIIDVWVCRVMYAYNDKTLTEDVSFSHMLSLLQPISRNCFFRNLFFLFLILIL